MFVRFLFQWITFQVISLLITHSYALTSFSKGLTYDSTDWNLVPYSRSQGLFGYRNIQSMSFLTHFDRNMKGLGATLVQNQLFIRVIYAFVDDLDKEFIFSVTSAGTIEGYSIPIVNQTNNQPGASYFFTYKDPFSFRFSIQNGYNIKSISNIEIMFDQISQTFLFYMCSSDGVLYGQSNTSLKQEIQILPISKFQIDYLHTCTSMKKINEDYILINNNYLCGYLPSKSCSKIDTNIAPLNSTSQVLLVWPILYTNLFQYSLDMQIKNNYDWLNENETIKYIFNYKNQGKSILFILENRNLSEASIQLRQIDKDQTLIFTIFIKATSLEAYNLFYSPANEIHLIQSNPSQFAAIYPFCIDSSYDTSLESCINSSIKNCNFENEQTCLYCSNSTFINESQTCESCSEECENGCLSQTICKGCKSQFRDPMTNCSCLPPRIESGSMPKNCICPPNYFLDQSNNDCGECSSLFTSACMSCTFAECLDCKAGYFLSDNICYYCTSKYQNCSSCNSILCTECQVGFFLNSQSECIPCSSSFANCQECTSHQCVACSPSYFQSENQCISCPVACKDGCQSTTFCNACLSAYRNTQDSCKCIHGMQEMTNNLGESICECPFGSYLSSDQGDSCMPCTTISNCINCFEDKCLECNSQYFLAENGMVCEVCSKQFPSCLECTSSACTNCPSNYFINFQGQCEECPISCMDGCIDKTTCKSCYSQFRDPKQTCACLSNRIEQISLKKQLICSCGIGTFDTNSDTEACVSCKDSFGENCLECDSSTCFDCGSNSIFRNQSCQECSMIYGIGCKTCSQVSCLSCQNSITLTQFGTCECAPDETFIQNQCIPCSNLFTSDCVACTKATCIKCSDPNSTFITDSCQCNQNYFPLLTTDLNSSKFCVLCSERFGQYCKECNQDQCLKCYSNRIYNTQTLACECPESYSIDQNSDECLKCSELTSIPYCSTCKSSSCLTCDGTPGSRDLSNKCNCSQPSAIEVNGSCYYCDLVSTSSWIYSSMFQTESILMPCDFDTKIGSLTLSIEYNFSYIEPSTKQILNSTISIPLSYESQLLNFPFPQGTSSIIGRFYSLDKDLIYEKTLKITKNAYFSSLADYTDSYLSSSAPSMSFSQTESYLCIAEILEMVALISNAATDSQLDQCEVISQYSNICKCKSNSNFFADCSGNESMYLTFQKAMINYALKLQQLVANNQNKLIQIQLQSILPIIMNSIDENFLKQSPKLVEYLIDFLKSQLGTFFNGSYSSIPADFMIKSCALLNNIAGIISSINPTLSQVKTVISIASQIQSIALQTISPYLPTDAPSLPVHSIKSDEILSNQMIIDCYESHHDLEHLTYDISTNSLIPNNNNSTSSCNEISTQQFNSSPQYTGFSAMLFDKNPFALVIPLPYPVQINKLLMFQNISYSSQNQSRILSSLEPISQYYIQFNIQPINPLNESASINATLFKCVFLNSTDDSNLKWSLCSYRNYSIDTNSLLCICPTKATYLYDGDNILGENQIQDVTEEIAEQQESDLKKQIILIILASVLAFIFLLMIILISICYNPKKGLQHVEFEDQIQQINDHENDTEKATLKSLKPIPSSSQTGILNINRSHNLSPVSRIRNYSHSSMKKSFSIEKQKRLTVISNKEENIQQQLDTFGIESSHRYQNQIVSSAIQLKVQSDEQLMSKELDNLDSNIEVSKDKNSEKQSPIRSTVKVNEIKLQSEPENLIEISSQIKQTKINYQPNFLIYAPAPIGSQDGSYLTLRNCVASEGDTSQDNQNPQIKELHFEINLEKNQQDSSVNQMNALQLIALKKVDQFRAGHFSHKFQLK